MPKGYTMSINDEIWEKPSVIGEGTLRDDWNKAVQNLADHIELQGMSGSDNPEDLAQSFLLETYANMSMQTPEAKPEDIITHISLSYTESKDLGWTMNTHSLLRFKP